MIINFTPSGGSATELANIANKKYARLEQLGAAGVEERDALALAATQFLTMRGNVAGDCVFTVDVVSASRAAAATYFVGQFALIGSMGALVLTIDATTYTMAGAAFKGVQAVKLGGTTWSLRYSFGITTLVSP